MSLFILKDDELETSFHQVVKSERKIMHEVILHVQEISRRKMYLAKGYPSLFDYLVRVGKYSGAAAQRRIEAARLISEVPVVADKLQAGDLNLSQIGDIQRAVKESEKLHQAKVTSEKKAALVQQVLGQNTSATQAMCAEALNIPVVKPESVKTQKDKSRKIEITLSEKQFAKYEKVRGLIAHANFQKKRTQEMSDVLETLFEDFLGRKGIAGFAIEAQVIFTEKLEANVEKKREVETKKAVESKDEGGNPEFKHFESLKPGDQRKNVTALEVDRVEWKSLTPKRKNIILMRDRCCQYEDPETGKACGSDFDLQVDHIIPKKMGGMNYPGNLRVLCRAHNLFRELPQEKVSAREIWEYQ